MNSMFSKILQELRFWPFCICGILIRVTIFGFNDTILNGNDLIKLQIISTGGIKITILRDPFNSLVIL